MSELDTFRLKRAIHAVGEMIQAVESELVTRTKFNSELIERGKGDEINYLKLNYLDGRLEALQDVLTILNRGLK